MKADLLAGCLIFAGAIALYAFGGLPPLGGPGGNRAAAFWPTLMLGLLALLGATLAVQSFLTQTRSSSVPLPTESAPSTVARNVCALLTYMPALFLLGFYVSAFAFALMLPPLLGSVGWRRSALFAVALTAIVWAVFGAALRIDLPAGYLVEAWRAQVGRGG